MSSTDFARRPFVPSLEARRAAELEAARAAAQAQRDAARAAAEAERDRLAGEAALRFEPVSTSGLDVAVAPSGDPIRLLAFDRAPVSRGAWLVRALTPGVRRVVALLAVAGAWPAPELAFEPVALHDAEGHAGAAPRLTFARARAGDGWLVVVSTRRDLHAVLVVHDAPGAWSAPELAFARAPSNDHVIEDAPAPDGWGCHVRERGAWSAAPVVGGTLMLELSRGRAFRGAVFVAAPAPARPRKGR